MFSSIVDHQKFFSEKDKRLERRNMLLKALAYALIAYITICFLASGLVLLSVVAGTSSLGESISWLHWPLKLLSLI